MTVTPSLDGLPRDNRVLLCVKAALTAPKLVDEYLALIRKRTGIPQFSVSLPDLEQVIMILKSSSVFWPRARAMGFGAEKARPQRGQQRRQTRLSQASSESSSSDSESSSSSSSSSSSGSVGFGGLDLGFSDDENETKNMESRKRIPRRKKKTSTQTSDSDEDMKDVTDSSSSASDSSSNDESNAREDTRSPAPPAAAPKVAPSQSSSSSSSSSSDTEEDMKNGKKNLKKKLSGLAARRRAEQAATASPDGVKQQQKRKLRQPYAYANSGSKENLQPSSSNQASPEKTKAPKKPRVELSREPSSDRSSPEPPAPSVEEMKPDSVPVADWNSDFGRVLRQAIDNRKICPFRTLGLPQTSSMADVKKRWAKLCLLLHPDKAPSEWKLVPELVDANQAVNEAKKAIEQRFQAVSLVRPQRPQSHPQPFTLDKGTFGKRRVEIRWTPSVVSNGRERVERYLVFIIQGGDARRRDQMLNAGSVKEGTDPFFVIVEDDQRFARFFNSTSITVSILATNAAGNSDPLTILVPLR
jgi:hypothetical protein